MTIDKKKSEQKTVEANNLKYVFRSWLGIPFRFRIWLAGKIIPKHLSHMGRAWAMGIEIELRDIPRPNRAQRRQKK